MKQEIQVFDYATEILNALKNAVLITTKADGKVNSMTIGWGKLGIEWKTPIFITYVREGRFTREQLDKNPEFTVNIPYGAFDPKILSYCGSKSGRNTNKIKDLDLTLESPVSISVPGIKEFPLTLECRVVYKQLQDRNQILPEHLKNFYPQDKDSSFPTVNKDLHIAYYGEILSAYIIM